MGGVLIGLCCAIMVHFFLSLLLLLLANAYLNSLHYSSEYNSFYSTDMSGKKTEGSF
jgi:hypothetical protein